MNDKKITNYEEAEKFYNEGMKIKDIALRFGVSENTVKSWRSRYKWRRKNVLKGMQKVAGCIEMGNNFDVIKRDLLTQLKKNGVEGAFYTDLVDSYMELFKIKNNLIIDIHTRGVAVHWENGKQCGIKRNDCIPELNKTISQMLSIIADLGLKPPSPNGGGGGSGGGSGGDPIGVL